jgi:pimeloyl-ACP methyl ester carboxylesterase
MPTAAVAARSRLALVRRIAAAGLLALVATRGSALDAPSVAGDPIERSEYLHVGGADLYLETRGAHRGAPVLLWLHGGPGGAERPLFRYFDAALEDRFVVAYWDQRGAGRSFDPAADPRDLTIARHLADLDEVVDHLRSTLREKAIVLIGHSWGGALALLYAHAHPQKLAAIIAVSPIVSTREQEKAQFDFLSRTAALRDDAEVLARLREIGPPPYRSAAAGLATEKLAARYGAVFHREPNRLWVMASGVLRGLATPWEVPRFIRANETSLDAMHSELQTLDLFVGAASVETPVFLFLGRYDRHVDATIAASYLEKLNAPVKRAFWFENSAHNAPFEEPELFGARVSECLRSIGFEAMSE